MSKNHYLSILKRLNWKRWVSVWILILFVSTNHLMPSALAVTPAEFVVQSQPQDFLTDLSSIKAPEEFGEVIEFYKGTNDQAVILIQDAHAIPDAQRNIQQLINYFQQEHGVDLVALEGAAAPLDPTFFKSFPDKKVLREVFQKYYEDGEVTGGTAAAIFNDTKSVYFGVEDWDLYEEGLTLYLEATENEADILRKLDQEKKKTDEDKKKNYSENLLRIDRALDEFYSDSTNLLHVLKALAAVQKPEHGSQLALLLEESLKHQATDYTLEDEVKKLAKKVDRFFSSQAKLSSASERVAFNAHHQDFQTSRISSEQFGLFLKEIVQKHQILVKVSTRLKQLVSKQRKLSDIKGTKLFREFETYAADVKKSLFEGGVEEWIDHKSQELRLLDRLAKLEISHEDWQKVYLLISDRRFRGETKSKWIDGLELPDALRSHIAFYENAKKRDDVFHKNLLSHMQKKKSDIGLMVSGGFHTEGLAEKLKVKDISYLVVMPRIQSIPAETNYREHMRGNVSWKDYFQVEDGRVNLYKAFVRATRDNLLSNAQIEHQSGALLKQWRDQIIRDLADKNMLSEAAEYTRFIDELQSRSFERSKESLPQRFMAKVGRFISDLEDLETTNQITEQNILGLLKTATSGDRTYSSLDPTAYALAASLDLSGGIEQTSLRKTLRLDLKTPLEIFRKDAENIARSEVRSNLDEIMGNIPIPAAISFQIADVKFRKGETESEDELFVLELGAGTSAGFDGYDNLYEEQMMAKFWRCMEERGLPVLYIGAHQELLQADEAADQQDKRMSWETFSSLQNFRKLNQGMSRNIVEFAEQHGYYLTPGANFNSRELGSYSGAVLIKSGDDSIIAAVEAKDGLIVLDGGEMVLPTIAKKELTNSLFQEELSRFRPSHTYEFKNYSPDLAEQIQQQIGKEKLVIKPVGASQGRGIIPIEAENLDQVLKKILPNGPLFSGAPQSPEEYEAISSSTDPYDHWRIDQNPVFIIEAYEASDSVIVNENEYDGTMRVAYVTWYDQSGIHVEILGSYWKLPETPIGFGSLRDQSVSKIHLDETDSLVSNSAKVADDDERRVSIILSEKVIPTLYGKMLASSRAETVDRWLFSMESNEILFGLYLLDYFGEITENQLARVVEIIDQNNPAFSPFLVSIFSRIRLSLEIDQFVSLLKVYLQSPQEAVRDGGIQAAVGQYYDLRSESEESRTIQNLLADYQDQMEAVKNPVVRYSYFSFLYRIGQLSDDQFKGLLVKDFRVYRDLFDGGDFKSQQKLLEKDLISDFVKYDLLDEAIELILLVKPSWLYAVGEMISSSLSSKTQIETASFIVRLAQRGSNEVASVLYALHFKRVEPSQVTLSEMTTFLEFIPLETLRLTDSDSINAERIKLALDQYFETLARSEIRNNRSEARIVAGDIARHLLKVTEGEVSSADRQLSGIVRDVVNYGGTFQLGKALRSEARLLLNERESERVEPLKLRMESLNAVGQFLLSNPQVRRNAAAELIQNMPTTQAAVFSDALIAPLGQEGHTNDEEYIRRRASVDKIGILFLKGTEARLGRILKLPGVRPFGIDSGELFNPNKVSRSGSVRFVLGLDALVDPKKIREDEIEGIYHDFSASYFQVKGTTLSERAQMSAIALNADEIRQLLNFDENRAFPTMTDQAYLAYIHALSSTVAAQKAFQASA